MIYVSCCLCIVLWTDTRKLPGQTQYTWHPISELQGAFSWKSYVHLSWQLEKNLSFFLNKHIISNIQTYYIKYTNILYQIHKHIISNTQTYYIKYTNILYQIYKHYIKYTNILYQIHKHIISNIQIYYIKYTNILYQIYKRITSNTQTCRTTVPWSLSLTNQRKSEII